MNYLGTIVGTYLLLYFYRYVLLYNKPICDQYTVCFTERSLAAISSA